MGDVVGQFSSIASIGTATALAVKVIHRAGTSYPAVRKLPVWVIAAGVAVVLTSIARYVPHSIDGNAGDLVLQAVVNAATGSGFYGWLNDPTQSLHDADGDGISDSRQTSPVLAPPSPDPTDDGSIKLE